MVLIACASQIFSNLKIKYSMSELNFLAMVWALEHFRLIWANIPYYYKSRSTLINLHFCLSSTGNWSTSVEANTDVIHCFQFNAEQQLQFFEIFLASNAACITYSLQFEFSGYYSHDQPAQWLLFTTNRAQYGVDQLTFGQQIFFRGDKIYFQRRFFQCKMGGRTVIKQMVIVSDEKF